MISCRPGVAASGSAGGTGVWQCWRGYCHPPLTEPRAAAFQTPVLGGMGGLGPRGGGRGRTGTHGGHRTEITAWIKSAAGDWAPRPAPPPGPPSHSIFISIFLSRRVLLLPAYYHPPECPPRLSTNHVTRCRLAVQCTPRFGIGAAWKATSGFSSGVGSMASVVCADLAARWPA